MSFQTCMLCETQKKKNNDKQHWTDFHCTDIFQNTFYCVLQGRKKKKKKSNTGLDQHESE